jgi:hypothetical protein
MRNAEGAEVVAAETRGAAAGGGGWGEKRGAPAPPVSVPLRRMKNPTSIPHAYERMNRGAMVPISNRNHNTKRTNNSIKRTHESQQENECRPGNILAGLQKIKMVAIKSVGHAITSSFAALYYTYGARIGFPVWTLIITVGMHFWFNMSIEKFKFSDVKGFFFKYASIFYLHAQRICCKKLLENEIPKSPGEVRGAQARIVGNVMLVPLPHTLGPTGTRLVQVMPIPP